MINQIKEIFLNFIPISIQRYYFKQQRFKKLKYIPVREVFGDIYLQNIWGKPDIKNDVFFSGAGSHKEEVVSAYFHAISQIVKTFDHKLNVVDLGCGDFAVGSQLRKYFKNYIACDVFEPLIKHNREKYKSLNVEFLVLDMITDDLPDGDLVFIRQVFQHLSNAQIMLILPKILDKYKYLVLTEHIPPTEKFKANVDKPMGSDTRLGIASGIVLTARPFYLKVIDETVLCDVFDEGGLIQTKFYTLH